MVATTILAACGVLYAGLGLWCLLTPQRVAGKLGYELPNPTAVNEFAVVYGGLELGLGAFLLIAAFQEPLHYAGLLMLFVTSLALALARTLMVLRLSNLQGIIYKLYASEVLLTILGGAGLWQLRA